MTKTYTPNQLTEAIRTAGLYTMNLEKFRAEKNHYTAARLIAAANDVAELQGRFGFDCIMTAPLTAPAVGEARRIYEAHIAALKARRAA